MHLHLVRGRGAGSAECQRPAKVVALEARRQARLDAAHRPAAAPAAACNMSDGAGRRTQRGSRADVAEPAYAPVSETGGFGHEGSTPSVRTLSRASVAQRIKSTGLRPRAQRFESSRGLPSPKGPLARPFRLSKAAELAAGDGHGGAADHHTLERVGAAVGLRVERRGRPISTPC